MIYLIFFFLMLAIFYIWKLSFYQKFQEQEISDLQMNLIITMMKENLLKNRQKIKHSNWTQEGF